MKYKAFLAASVVTASTAFAAFPVGDGEAFLTGTVGYKYDDNVYLSNTNAKATGVATFTPGVSVEFGADALAKNILTLSEQFIRYTSASSQNNELFQANYTGTYSDTKSTIDLAASYAENAQNNRDARLNGVIVENTLTSVNPKFEWTLSPKTSFDVATLWENNNYKTTGFSDRTSWSIPANFYYEVAPKLKASVGYRHRSDDQQGAADGTDEFYNLGAKGEFTPKLTGSFNIGYNERTTKSFGTTRSSKDSSVGIISNFNFAFSEKTQFRASIGNDYQNGGTGATQQMLKIGGGVTSALSQQLTIDASLDYSKNDYLVGSRSDDLWNTKIGATYKYNKYVNLKGEYTYQNNASNSAGSDFKGNTFAVSASIRY
jgi:hypothetical protein